MNLFELNSDTGLPQFDPIVFELQPFKKVIESDKTKDKNMAKAELAFIWFYSDPKSDYFGAVDEEQKVNEIKSILGLPNTWKISVHIRNAIDFYRKITQTTSTILLEKMRKTINKLSIFLEDIDFTKEDKSGKLIYDMKKVVDTTNQIPKLLSTLKEVEIRVKEEQEQVEREIRGGKQLAVWEDGIDFTN